MSESISAKSFAKTCDLVICHAYHEMYVEPVPEKTPKRIFITGDHQLFERFLHKLSSFKEKFELVYHYSDAPFDRHKFEAIRPYVTKIYAVNSEIAHPMIQRLPIGFMDDKVPRSLNLPRDILCYVNLGLYNTRELKFVNCRAIRKRVLDYFKGQPWAVVDEARIPFDEFMEKLNRSEYVVCPVGFGLDTHRFYEASYVGATPIVTRSAIEDVHRRFKPLIVESYEDLSLNFLRSRGRESPDQSLFHAETWITPDVDTKNVVAPP